MLPSEASRRRVGEATPLLDISTLSKEIFPDQGRFVVTNWVGCAESSIALRLDEKVANRRVIARQQNREKRVKRAEREGIPQWMLDLRYQEVDRETGELVTVNPRERWKESALSRSKTRIRRYALVNELGLMMTLTFAIEPRFDQIDYMLQKFWQRWRYKTGESLPAYFVVPEFGTKYGRLHLHVGIGDWWVRQKWVEVCVECAHANLRAKRFNLAPKGSNCMGCLWGHGFVGAPRVLGDYAEASAYCSKYLAEDLDHTKVFGRQSYRVAKGFAPRAVSHEVESLQQAVELMRSFTGDEVEWAFTSSDRPELKLTPSLSVRAVRDKGVKYV